MGAISERAKTRRAAEPASPPAKTKAAPAPTRVAATAAKPTTKTAPVAAKPSAKEKVEEPFEEIVEDDDDDEEIVEDDDDDEEIVEDDDDDDLDDEDEEGDDGDDIEDDETDEDDDSDEDEESDEDDDYMGDEDDDDDESEVAGSNGHKADPASFNAKRKTVTLDFTGADDKPPSIDPGEYNARVNDVEFTESQSGNPMLKWVFKITSGPYKNKDLSFWTSMKQDARWSSARTLAMLGIPVAGKKFTLDPEKIIGKPCKILVVHDGRNEDFPYKVQRVIKADAAAIKAAKAAKNLI